MQEPPTPAPSPASSVLASTESWHGLPDASPPGAAPQREPPPDLPCDDPRYSDLGRIALGGMADVRRVYDSVLARVVAMKLLQPQFAHTTAMNERFRAEACLVARLNHPAIVSIHDYGTCSDGRLYFTMPEVSGSTFREVIGRAHSALDPEQAPDLPMLRRLVSQLRQACEGVACAHAEGVVHRDLKPSNIMVGRFGEVLVLDWGIATLFQSPHFIRVEPLDPDGGSALSPLALHEPGFILGTLTYMAPEQVRTSGFDIGPPADVYALGGILFEILAGRPPRSGSKEAVLRRAREARRPELGNRARLPAVLVEICERALSPEPEARYPDAGELAQALGGWLEGVENIERARRMVMDSDGIESTIESARAEAQALRAQAQAILEKIDPVAPEAVKRPGWAAEDAARELEARVVFLQTQREQLLRGALNLVPDLDEAHRRLADYYRRCHEQAERSGEEAEARRFEFLLREHDRGWHQEYLSGEGRLHLVTSRPVRVRLDHYEIEGRRAHPRPFRDLGPSPIGPIALPVGSYRAVLTDLETGLEVLLPLQIERAQTWCGALPGTAGQPPIPATLHITRPDELGPDTCYVPAGPFWSGGDPQAYGQSLPLRQVHIDGFAIQRHPVTNAEFIAFLDDLVAAGREADALRYAPREAGLGGNPGPLVYGRDADGRFVLIPDADGDLWPPDWPVVMIPVEAMEAYAAWLTARTGHPWRLPWELEWEKAARGGDLRVHVWGTAAFDPTWCCMTESHGSGRRNPVSVHAFPADESPYGVRGLAGNVLDICADAYTPTGPIIQDGHWQPRPADPTLRTGRGGNWASARGKTRVAYRGPVGVNASSPLAGFRLVHSVG